MLHIRAAFEFPMQKPYLYLRWVLAYTTSSTLRLTIKHSSTFWPVCVCFGPRTLQSNEQKLTVLFTAVIMY